MIKCVFLREREREREIYLDKNCFHDMRGLVSFGEIYKRGYSFSRVFTKLGHFTKETT